MSRIYFHTPGKTVEVLGPERAHAGLMTDRVGHGAMDVFHNLDRLRELLNPAHDLAQHRTSGEMITWSFWFEQSTGWDRGTPLLVYAGRPLSSGDLVANTALAVGSDPMRLLTRLHGQCELHGYVEGPNRAWLADIIQAGLDSGVLRKTLNGRDLGWAGVITLLRDRDDEPVVTSYSVTDWFPNKDVADWRPPEGTDLAPAWAAEEPEEWAALTEEEQAEYRDDSEADLWSDLPADQRWRLAVDGLRRSNRTMLLEFKPDDWATFRFGHGLTAFDLYEPDWRDRITAALGLEKGA